ncbi:MAG: efflux RND transporter periplasmic adaptor subunit [Acidobacteriota bacterium]|nr:efflux RND transporter periplasmic adaptor subunit [Acidobacteriota bacterium]
MAVMRGGRLWLGGAVLAAALVGALWCSDRGPVLDVRTGRVVRGPLEVWVQSNGKVQPVEPHVLRARLATFVRSVNATEGQAVKAGQLLLTLDDTAARASLAQAREELLNAQEQLRIARAGGPADQVAQVEGDLQKTRAELAKLQRDRTELQKLLAQQAATREEVDQNALAISRAQASLQVLEARQGQLKRSAALDLQAAGFRVSQARDTVRTLEAQVAGAEVRSPIDGTVYLLPVRVGDYVQVGAALADLADLSRMQVEAFVDEPDIGSLAVGQPVTIAWDAAPGQVWPGRTERIPKAIVARGNRNVGRVICGVENDRTPRLLPDVNVDVRIQVHDRQNVLLVPRGAVRGEGTARYVYVVDHGVLARMPIQVGAASVTQYEVLGGVTEGTQVVVSADADLRPGMAVTPVSSGGD